MSYFDMIPTELFVFILDDKTFLDFIEAFPSLSEGTIKIILNKYDPEIYADINNIMKNVNISWKDMMEPLIIQRELVGRNRSLRSSIVEILNIEKRSIIKLDLSSKIHDTSDVYYPLMIDTYNISLALLVLNKSYDNLFNYIIDKGLYSKYGLEIFTFIWLNIHGHIKNIVLNVDLNFEIIQDIIRLSDINF